MSTATDVAKVLVAEVEQVERKLVEAEREVARLAKDNSRLCDEVFDAEQALKAANEKIAELAVQLAEFQTGNKRAA